MMKLLPVPLAAIAALLAARINLCQGLDMMFAPAVQVSDADACELDRVFAMVGGLGEKKCGAYSPTDKGVSSGERN